MPLADIYLFILWIDRVGQSVGCGAERRGRTWRSSEYIDQRGAEQRERRGGGVMQLNTGVR